MTLPEDRIRTVGATEREAYAWVVRLTSGQATAADAEALKAWCARSAAHRAAFARAQQLWRQLGSAGQEVSNWMPLAQQASPSPRLRLRRRAFVSGALAAPAALAAMALWQPPLRLWPSLQELRADYRTATGQQRRIPLAEQAVVDLDAQSSISLRPAGRGDLPAGLELVSGRAAVQVTVQTRLAIWAGAGCAVIDPGPASLDVRYLEGQVRVSCLSGDARIEHGNTMLRLHARQQVAYWPERVGGIVAIEPSDVSAWQQGVLVFRQATLAEVVDELNRYRAGKVVVMDDRLAAEPVSGRFRIDDPEAALEHLRLALDLPMQRYPGGLVLLG